VASAIPSNIFAKEIPGQTLSRIVLSAIATFNAVLAGWAAISTATNDDLTGGAPRNKLPKRGFVAT
jgi:hypothetical protein